MVAFDLNGLDIQALPLGQLGGQLARRRKMGLLAAIVYSCRALETGRVRQRRPELQLAAVADIEGHIAGCVLGVLA